MPYKALYDLIPPPQLCHLTFPHSSLLQITPNYKDLIHLTQNNTYPWLRVFAFDLFLSPEHGSPRYLSSRLCLSSVYITAPENIISLEGFPNHLYKTTTFFFPFFSTAFISILQMVCIFAYLLFFV